MGEWDAWIGREEHRHGVIDAAVTARWLATFDRDPPAGGAAPQAIHWCVCVPEAPTARLGTDGHPLRDDGAHSFLPPLPLPRRMWAASTVAFIRPLLVSEAVTRTSRVLSVTEKSGASGALVFVDVAHETSGAAGLAVRERQSLVYRAAAAVDAPLEPAPVSAASFGRSGWDAHRVITPPETLLFRYSALTFNSHRIHYDLAYAQGVERYRGLVVHGPLTATLLLDLARRSFGDNALTRFSFRGLSPAVCGDELHLVMRGARDAIELAAFAADGRAIMSATAQIKDEHD